MQLKIKNFWFLIIVLSFTGCSTVPPKPEERLGSYHRVEKGQTLWRIAKLYDIDLDEIIRANRIQDVTTIETGQLIFIPHRQKQENMPISYANEDFTWPLKGEVLSTFKQAYQGMVNKGINIKPLKKKEVVAARGGKVVFYNPNLGNFGKIIILEHNDGFLSIYARNAETYVRTGDIVPQGAIIAKAGVYLHFEIRKNRIPQNPFFYLPR